MAAASAGGGQDGARDFEYVRNVVLQLYAGTDAAALLPVLATVLELSPAEVDKCRQGRLVVATGAGGGGAGGAAAASSGATLVGAVAGLAPSSLLPVEGAGALLSDSAGAVMGGLSGLASWLGGGGGAAAAVAEEDEGGGGGEGGWGGGGAKPAAAGGGGGWFG